MKHLIQNGGFSLIEMLVYISLLVLVSSTSVLLLLSLQDELSKQKASRLLTRTGTVAVERIIREIRQSDSVDLAGSTLTENPGKLQLVNDEGTVEFGLEDQAITYYVDDVLVDKLSDNNVTVFSLRFYFYDNGRTEFVRLKLGATATINGETVSEYFYSGAELRGSYE